MDMTGEYRIPAPRQKVWEALNDPEVLKTSIPGCEEIEKVSDTEMNAKVRAKVGPVSARFAGTVTLGDMNPPESYTISGEGKGGAAGFAKGGARVSLAEDGADATVLSYTAHANVGGKMAQLGSRLIQSTAKKMADEFFGNFSAQLGGGRAGAAAAPGATVAAGEAAAPAGAGVEPGTAEAAAAAALAPAAPPPAERAGRPEPPQAAAAPALEPTPTAAAAPSPAAAAQTTQPAAPAPSPAAAAQTTQPAAAAEAVAPARAEAVAAPAPPPRSEPRPAEPPRPAPASPSRQVAGGKSSPELRERLTHPLVVVSAAVAVLVLLFLIF